MKEKVFKTLDEQIDILEKKNLKIDDVDYAKKILLRENYFFLMGYRHLFLKNNNKSQFIDTTEFREIYALFSFDRQLRNIIFKNILIIENNAKSIFSYVLSSKYAFGISFTIKGLKSISHVKYGISFNKKGNIKS